MLESSTHSIQNIGVPNQLRAGAETVHDDHRDDRYHSIPQSEYYLSHKDIYLRKGKWTTEEERYANKVIEYFNGGILKLDDHERGITLRAYLAQKLGCDPMRITKKYTGASCLGKRVYHAYKQGGKNEEVDKATEDLNILEEEFRSRLQQMNKRRGGGGGYSESQVMVSTPAIDSMLQQSGYPSSWHSQHPGLMYGYPMPGYMSGIASGHNAVEMHMRRQQQYQHQHPAGFQNGGQSSAEASPYASSLEQQQHGGRGARSYSSDQTTAPDYSPTLSGLRYGMDPSLDHDHDHEWGQQVKMEGSSGPVGRAAMQSSTRTGAHRKGSEGSTSSGGSSTTNRQKKLPKGDRGAQVAERHPPDPDSSAQDGLLQRVKVSEHDTEAASSLLGFFTQLERNSSQEDMLHFFEGVQKNVAAATVAAGQSPSKGSHSNGNGNGNGIMSGNAAGGNIGGMSSAHFVNFPPLPPASMSSK